MSRLELEAPSLELEGSGLERETPSFKLDVSGLELGASSLELMGFYIYQTKTDLNCLIHLFHCFARQCAIDDAD